MKKYKRIFTIVIDSFGAGEMPDAAQYGDEGTDTMGHISQNVDEFTIPNLQKLGIANLHPLKQVAAVERPMGYYTFLKEASTGKDTMTGHWEMMGLHITKPFKTFTETGFPKELIDELEKRTGHKVIGNKSSSSDIDFVVYGCNNLMQLEDDLQQIETLRKIDIFDFDSIKNEYLLEDIKKYGKQIY